MIVGVTLPSPPPWTAVVHSSNNPLLFFNCQLTHVGVLREVCDKALSDPTVPKATLLKRASALKIIGAVFEGVKPDNITPSPSDKKN